MVPAVERSILPRTHLAYLTANQMAIYQAAVLERHRGNTDQAKKLLEIIAEQNPGFDSSKFPEICALYEPIYTTPETRKTILLASVSTLINQIFHT